MVSGERLELDWEDILIGVENTNLKFLQVLGFVILPNGNNRILTQLMMIGTLILFLFMCFILLVTVLLTVNDFAVFVETAHAFFICVITLKTYLTHHLKISTFFQIMKNFSSDSFTYEIIFERERSAKMRTQVKKYTKYMQMFAICLIWSTAFLFTVSPYLQVMFIGKEKREISSVNFNYPIPLWFPFNTRNLYGFLLGYCIIISTVCMVALLVTTYVPSLILYYMELYTQLNTLNHSIMDLDVRALALLRNSNTIVKNGNEIDLETFSPDDYNAYQRCIRHCLTKNVQHYRAIRRFRDLVQSYSGTFLGDVLFVSALMVVAISLILSKSDLSMSPENIKYICLLSVELINLFFYCLCGTLVKEKSLSVQTALFHSPWLQLSQSNKKILQIFQICSNKPLVLKGVGTFEINLEMYLQVLNTTYSMFNVMNSVNS